MSEADREMYDALFKTAHRQRRLIGELLTRVTELERRLREHPEPVETTRPTLRVAERDERSVTA